MVAYTRLTSLLSIGATVGVSGDLAGGFVGDRRPIRQGAGRRGSELGEVGCCVALCAERIKNRSKCKKSEHADRAHCSPHSTTQVVWRKGSDKSIEHFLGASAKNA